MTFINGFITKKPAYETSPHAGKGTMQHNHVLHVTLAADAKIRKTALGHGGRRVQITAVKKNGRLQELLDPLKIRIAELIPFRLNPYVIRQKSATAISSLS